MKVAVLPVDTPFFNIKLRNIHHFYVKRPILAIWHAHFARSARDLAFTARELDIRAREIGRTARGHAPF